MRCEKPVVSMSSSGSSIWRAARNCRLRKRCADPRGKQASREQRGRGRPVYAIQQQIVALNTERTRRKQTYPTHVQAIEDLLTTKLGICQIYIYVKIAFIIAQKEIM